MELGVNPAAYALGHSAGTQPFKLTFNYPCLLFYILNVLIVALSITVLLLATYSSDAFAQYESGGVDKEGEWYVG